MMVPIRSDEVPDVFLRWEVAAEAVEVSRVQNWHFPIRPVYSRNRSCDIDLLYVGSAQDRLIEINPCVTDVNAARSFVDSYGRQQIEGNSNCYDDPVNGCSGGCCRLGKNLPAFFCLFLPCYEFQTSHSSSTSTLWL